MFKSVFFRYPFSVHYRIHWFYISMIGNATEIRSMILYFNFQIHNNNSPISCSDKCMDKYWSSSVRVLSSSYVLSFLIKCSVKNVKTRDVPKTRQFLDSRVLVIIFKNWPLPNTRCYNRFFTRYLANLLI